jgi:hypothetical protein
VPPPPPPATVRAQAGPTGKVSVTWSEVPFVQLFKIQYRDLDGAPARPANAGSFPGSSATIGPLRSDHSYDISVVAVGGGGESKPSAPARVTVKVKPPAAPATAPTATARPDGSVDLAWPQVAPGLAYKVRSRDITAGETRLSRPAIATGTTHRARHLKHNHVYEFAVAAVNDGGEGALSAPVRVRARVAAPGTAPVELRAEIEDDGVDLRWRSPSAWHWLYRRDVTAGAVKFTRDDIPVEGTRTTVRGLLDGHVYELRVAGFTPGGVGPQSEPLRVTMPSAVPVDVWAVATGPGNVRLSWRETRPGLTYRVQLRDATNGEQWRLDPFPVQGNRYDAVLLTSGHRYEFRVLANGEPSATAVVTVE